MIVIYGFLLVTKDVTDFLIVPKMDTRAENMASQGMPNNDRPSGNDQPWRGTPVLDFL